MAFIIENFRSGRGINFSNAPSTGTAIHTYKNLDDSFNTVTTSGYFPAYFGQEPDNIKTNDYIYLITGTRASLTKYSAVSPVPILEEIFNFNITTGTFPLTFQGPWSSPQSITVRYEAMDNLVVLTFPSILAITTEMGVMVSALGTMIPSNLRPLDDYAQSIPVYGSQLQEGYVNIVRASGLVTIYTYTPGGTGSSTYGFPNFSVIYYKG